MICIFQAYLDSKNFHVSDFLINRFFSEKVHCNSNFSIFFSSDFVFYLISLLKMKILNVCKLLVFNLIFRSVQCSESFYCFPSSNENTTSLNPFPKKDDFFAERDVEFILFSNSDEPYYIQANKQSLESSSFDVSLPTRIIIHGYCDGPFDKDFQDMRAAFRKNGNFNVIMVDWSKGSVTMAYNWAK